jgi:hypothetical protein
VIDFLAVRRKGAHAIYVDGPTMTVTTVADIRGDRPWSRSTARQRPYVPRAPRVSSRLVDFASPTGLTQRASGSHPGVEDDDGLVVDEEAYGDALR